MKRHLKETSDYAEFVVFIISLVAIFACFTFAILTAGCSSPQKLYTPNVNETYKRDLPVEINGVEFIGVGVAPAANTYKVKVTPPGKIDRIMWRTCNREEVVDKPDLGWGKSKYEFDVTLIEGLEDMAACGLSITVLEEKKRRNGFAFIEFQDKRPEISLHANLSCNGRVVQNKGVSICQSSEGLYQQIEFGTAVVQKGSSEQCDVMKPLDETEKKFRFIMPAGECTYYFVAKERAPNGKRYSHRLSTIGYTDVPPIQVK